MASTYSPNLRLELIGTGEQQGTWGNTTNVNLGTLLEEAIGGYASVTVSDVADTTLTTNNGAADQSRNMVLNLTGALTATRNVICPAIEKVYIVKNATSGGYAVTFKVSGQTGVTVPNGATVLLYVDGTDARSVTGSIASQSANNVAITGGSITGITDLAIADGGTGASNASDARTNLGLGTIATQNANNVTITGGSVTGITDLAIADGGTGASDAATARTNLGLGTMATQNAADYATLASPALTGTPTTPTATAYTNTTQIASTAEVYSTVTTVPENAQTGTSYTLALSDAGKVVTLSNASAITLTIPTNAVVAFPLNTRVDIIQYGAGQVTVGGSGVTIRSSASYLKLAGQYSGATLWKKGTDEWVLIGDLTI